MSSPTTYAFLILSISIFIIVFHFTLMSNRHETVCAVSIIQKSDVKEIVIRMRSFVSFGFEETLQHCLSQ